MDTKPPFSPGEQVRVLRPKTSDAVKQRLYRVEKVNPQLDMVQLEWLEAPYDFKERYVWVLKDLVQKA
jgi:hypothetical protein